jgi:soluble lytic murein transglycosylase-like protein
MKSAVAFIVLAMFAAAPASAARKAKPSRAKKVKHVYTATARVDKRVPASLRPIIEQAGRRHKVDPRLIAAVARRESRFRARAVSPVGARGLMQLMPRTARWLGVKDSFNPRQSIFAGTKYLSMLLRKYNGNIDLTLAAYNAGPGAVKKYRGIPPFRETRAYVAAIRRDYLASL